MEQQNATSNPTDDKYILVVTLQAVRECSQLGLHFGQVMAMATTSQSKPRTA